MRHDRLMRPAVHCLQLALWPSSALGRTIDWAGRRYRLTGFGQAEILGE